MICWEEQEAYKVAIEGMSMPIINFENEIRILQQPKGTLLKLTTSFQGKGFFSEMFFGFIMMPILKMKLKQVLNGFVEAVSTKVRYVREDGTHTEEASMLKAEYRNL